MGQVMAECQGHVPMSTKVDQRTVDRIDNRANELGVSRAEYLRRLIDAEEKAREGGECPECGTSLEFQV